MVTSRHRVLGGLLAGVIVIAGGGWAVGTRLRSPADEAALRQPPKPSLITSPVVRRKLTSTVAVSGTLAYGSPLPVTLAGVVGGAAEAQRVTRAPRPGKIAEGSVLMEVNGRPVFALRGKVPMHRTMTPGATGTDIRQLQAALRRLGFGAPSSGVFDSATTAAVQRWYAKRGYAAQEPDLTAKQTREQLRQAVQAAEETLLTDRKTLDAGRDVLPLRLKLDNAREDLRAAEDALEKEDSADLTPEETHQVEDLRRAVRAGEEEVLAAEQALTAARSPQTLPTAKPEAAPPTPKPEAALPTAKPEDRRLLELRVSNARQNLESARTALDAFGDQASAGKEKRLGELRRAVRLGQETVAVAEQALRQARQNSPLQLKVTNGGKNVASARSILAEYLKTYGIGIPPGEIVFLPALPARLDKAEVKPGDAAEGKVATVTSSAFAVTGSVESREAKLLRKGMEATLETADETRFPAVLSATGDAARPAEAEEKAGGAGATGVSDEELGSVPVLLTPTVTKGLRGLVGAPVTVKISVGATENAVLTVPVAAVVTSANGRPRVQVELPGGDKTGDVEVRTGLTADGTVEVTPVKPGALKEGDRVVVSGA
ncbi:Putative peptidoglycan binding domain-containing protein [Streptosporangium subroseum]|uniref:Putative peptidoglycan binding domain-containing protein n=1 Tax=Streptosporangium subroseum TaxID=106412 RepID=A0A239MH26_9ACTN|nr:peptidoglycan-binding domain-containing protein [Streptosporangium subroseum]SNT42015.1 Putative peptidoglycan binding domain-containing protein [Streptosporangium subroseum]